MQLHSAASCFFFYLFGFYSFIYFILFFLGGGGVGGLFFEHCSLCMACREQITVLRKAAMSIYKEV